METLRTPAARLTAYSARTKCHPLDANGISRRGFLVAAVATHLALWSAHSRAATAAAGIAPRGAPTPSPGTSQEIEESLPSWNDGAAREAILEFVRAAIDESSASFVPAAERIATFDQDGTLWVEQPTYTQSFFALDRVKALAADHPAWNSQQPFAAILSGNEKAIASFSEQDWEEIIGVTHAGMTVDAYIASVADWLATARDRRFDRPFTELIYQPMLEVMALLRANGFRTYIVSGGGQEFIRAYAEAVYGVPPEHVIGTSFETEFEYAADGTPVLIKQAKPQLNDNNGGKVEDINLFIGRRPCAAFGNSTGDQQMLEWTGAGNRARLMMLVYHDDAEREYAYGPAGGLPDTSVGTFTDALMTEAQDKGWSVISMKNDWNSIFS
jgi:phosphoserine phosphatase